MPFFKQPMRPELLPTPEDDIRRELEGATTLTEVIGILYHHVNELRGSMGTYSPDDFAAFILNVTDDLRDWQRRKSRITNQNIPLRGVVNRILFEQGEFEKSVAKDPSFADWLLRKNFGKGGNPEKSFAPVDDMPEDPEFYRRPMTEEEYYKAIEQFRPTYRRMPNRQFIDFLLQKMGRTAVWSSLSAVS